MSRRPAVRDEAWLTRWCVPEPNTGCWLWEGATMKGYGRVAVLGVRHSASRVAWIVFFGPIPAGLHVLHRCDTPACVNPEHLFLGTHRDNMRDMSRKGRNRATRLTWAAVEEIRASTETGTALARRFGVGRAAIHHVRKGIRWRAR